MDYLRQPFVKRTGDVDSFDKASASKKHFFYVIVSVIAIPITTRV
jgi:hypothetical protein